MIVFIAMAISSFYFWSKGQEILRRYITWKDAFMFWGIKVKVPEHEWRLFKKYTRYQFLCFFSGIILIIFLYILQWNFHLFIKDTKQP